MAEKHEMSCLSTGSMETYLRIFIFRILSLMVLGTIIALPLHAQSAITSSGGNASGSGGTANPERLSYKLIDINGVLLINNMIRSSETSIYFSGYKPGTYFLKVALDNREIKTFKIIKN